MEFSFRVENPATKLRTYYATKFINIKEMDQRGNYDYARLVNGEV